MTFIPAIDPDIEYPDSDGKPMADNTEQYEWIVKIKENLEILFANVASHSIKESVDVPRAFNVRHIHY